MLTNHQPSVCADILQHLDSPAAREHQFKNTDINYATCSRLGINHVPVLKLLLTKEIFPPAVADFFEYKAQTLLENAGKNQYQSTNL